MDYREDEHDFREPLEAEIARVKAGLNQPLKRFEGADAAMAKLLAERDALNRFSEELADRVRWNTLTDLPGVRTGWIARSTSYRVLEHHPYRGIILIDPPSDTAVGLVFLKHPYDPIERISALGDRWRSQSKPKEN